MTLIVHLITQEQVGTSHGGRQDMSVCVWMSERVKSFNLLKSQLSS